MDLKLIKELAFKHLGRRMSHLEREPGYTYYHGQRVAKIAVGLREALFPDAGEDEVMAAASYFHDIAKGIEPHGEYGALLAREVLRGHTSDQELEKIVEIIGAHQKRKKSDYPNRVLLVQDADILDHFGTMEIWLSFQHTVRAGDSLETCLEFYRHEYSTHLENCMSLLNYDLAKEILKEKDRFERAFVERLALETEGGFVLPQ